MFRVRGLVLAVADRSATPTLPQGGWGVEKSKPFAHQDPSSPPLHVCTKLSGFLNESSFVDLTLKSKCASAVLRGFKGGIMAELKRICLVCGESLPPYKGTGRRRLYCCRACQLFAHWRRAELKRTAEKTSAKAA